MILVYRRAAEVLDKLHDRQGSLKYIIFNKKCSDTLSFRKRVYAVAIETLKKRAVLERVIDSSHLLDMEPLLTRHLAMVLLFDYLYGRGIQCGGPLKYSITRHKDQLITLFKSLIDITDTSDSHELIPRYCQVNNIKCDLQTVITALERDGYTLSEGGGGGEKYFKVDRDIPDLLQFHPKAQLTNHSLCLNYHIILQDKASCLPAYLLSPPPYSRVIDCCAAPGNKTIQLSNIMNNKGVIMAYDKDPQRFQDLKKRLTLAGATCVQPILSDILKVTVMDAEYILVDPSCSGSGISHRMDYHLTEDVDKGRLKNLSSFQMRVLSHVLSFPCARKVVYSTCSIHKEENEMVVERALQMFGSEYELENLIPEWSCRGLPIFPRGERCLRLGPDNGTHGFFIAMFVRKNIMASSSSSSTSSPISHLQREQALIRKHNMKKKNRRRGGRSVPVTINT